MSFACCGVLSQSSLFGQNPRIGYRKFNGLQTPKLTKKQLCDRTSFYPRVSEWTFIRVRVERLTFCPTRSEKNDAAACQSEGKSSHRRCSAGRLRWRQGG